MNEPDSTRFARADSDEPMRRQQDPEWPPQPPNSWVLFHSHMAKERTDLECRAQSEVSALSAGPGRTRPRMPSCTSRCWPRPEGRASDRYPHYRFNPIKKADKVKAVRKAKAANDAIKKVQAARGSRSVSSAPKRKVRNSRTRSLSPLKNDPAPLLAD